MKKITLFFLLTFCFICYPKYTYPSIKFVYPYLTIPRKKTISNIYTNLERFILIKFGANIPLKQTSKNRLAFFLKQIMQEFQNCPTDFLHIDLQNDQNGFIEIIDIAVHVD